MKNRKFTFFFLALFSELLSAQQNLPLNREWNLQTELKNSNIDSTWPGKMEHTSFKPYFAEPVYPEQDKSKSLFYRKLKKENLFIVNDTADKFHLTIDPLFNFESGKDTKSAVNEILYNNTRGILLKGDIGKKFCFESSFYENQSTFVNYIDSFNNAREIVPGQGRWKTFKKTGYDYAMASGHISYSPNKHFNFQLGHGKHFVGDGYRSLLLSDNSFNYPYLRITSTFGKIQYTNLYAVFMNLASNGIMAPPNSEVLYQKKAASFQLLSWKVSKRIELGFFQGMIWEGADSRNRQHLDFYYFNPLIYSNILKYSLDNTNNILAGSTLRFKITDRVNLYGQYLLDDYGSGGSVRNKSGFQLGLKAFDLFKIKNLHFQAEYNQVRPYAYSASQPDQNYSHYNQSLADPLGANFKEAIVFLNYRLGNFFTQLKFNYAIIGSDSSGKNFGSDIFKPDNSAYYGVNSNNNKLGQGVHETLIYTDFHIGYLVNPSTNFNVVLGVSNRVENLAGTKSTTNYIYVGIRTSLTNLYYDF